METHVTKIVTAITIMIVIAYVVATLVSKKQDARVAMRAQVRQAPAHGDVWQTPVATAPAGDDYLVTAWG